MTDPLRGRPLEAGDLEACAAVFYEATNDLYERRHEPGLVRDPNLPRFLAWLALGEGGRGRVCLDERGRVVAFGIAFEREASWFLSFLFVAPHVQARGVGRALFQELLPVSGSPAGAPDAIRAVCVDSLQPISTGLYATFGLVPRVPIMTLTGHLPPGALAPLPRELEATEFAAAPLESRPFVRPPVEVAALPPDLLAELDAVDVRTLGFRRRGDHCRWLGDGRLLVRYRDRDGQPLAYAYAHQSGRVGPVACREEGLLEPVLGDVLRRVRPAGAWRIYVPGPARAALVPLLRAGLRFEGSPAAWCADRDGPAWERYLPASFALP